MDTDKLTFIEYLEPYYKAVKDHIEGNMARGRDTLNFSTGFIGLIVVGFSYILGRDVTWPQTLVVLFSILCGLSLICFFIAIFFCHAFLNKHRRIMSIPKIDDTNMILGRIDRDSLLKFEKQRYQEFNGFIDVANKSIKLYLRGFRFMICGLILLFLASAEIIIIKIGGVING